MDNNQNQNSKKSKKVFQINKISTKIRQKKAKEIAEAFKNKPSNLDISISKLKEQHSKILRSDRRDCPNIPQKKFKISCNQQVDLKIMKRLIALVLITAILFLIN